MRALRLLWNRLAGLTSRSRRESELASEFENHLACLTEDNIRAGMSADQARRAAALKFGAFESAKEGYRDQWGIPSVETVIQDVRFALRSFAKRPGLYAVIVTSLAIGIGLNTTAFTWLKAVYLNPLPGVVDARHLVSMNASYPYGAGYSNSFADFEYIRDHDHLLSGVFAHETLQLALTDGRSAQMTMGGIVSGNYFEVLGTTAEIGRTFRADEDQVLDRNPVVILSDRMWRNRFSADSNIAGTDVQLNGNPFTVIGVAEPGFVGVYGGIRQDFWIPLHMARAVDAEHHDTLASGSWLQIMGRPKAGVSLAEVRSEMELFARQMRTLHRKSDSGYGLAVNPLHQAERGFHSGLFELVRILGIVVVLLLLLACSNAASLLVGRATERSREISVRISLGAGRSRIIRQLLTESFLVTGIACLLSLVVVFATRSVLLLLAPPNLELYLNLDIDWRVLFFLGSAAVLTTFLFGLWPALETLKVNVADSLKEGSGNTTASRRRNFWRKTLVIGQVALAMTALFAAGLFAANFREKLSVARGFESSRLLTTSIDLVAAGLNENRGRTLYQQTAQNLERSPQVSFVAWTTFLPMSGSGGGNRRAAEVRGYVTPDGKPLSLVVDTVSPGYLKTLGIALVLGREFTWADTQNSAPALLVNEEFVKEYLPKTNPLGAQVRIGDTWRTIVGVHHNYVYRDPSWGQSPTVLLPLTQDYTGSAILLVRTKTEPLQVGSQVRNQINSFDRNIPIGPFITMDQNVSSHFAMDELAAGALGTFALIAASLAAMGIYAVLAAYMNQRRREFGIRVALGASPAKVTNQVLRESARVVIVGSAVGLLLSAGVGKLLASVILLPSLLNWRLYLATTIAIGLIAALSTLIPARRAFALDPLVALRSE